MNYRELRWGIMSTANIGRAAVIPAIAASSNGRVVAVASRDEARASDFAAANEIPHAHASYDALLEDPDVDALYIPLPNSLHLEWTIRAMEAGKHVLCEKPLALTEAECQRMCAVSDDTGMRLMEAFMYRFHPRTQRVLERVRGGHIGDLRLIRSCFTFRLTRSDNIRWDASLGGGALMDVGCYCVNVSRTMAGAEPIAAQATANWAKSGVDSEMIGTLRFPDGVLAHFDCSLSMERTEEYAVAGTDGSLVVPHAFLPGTEDAPIHHQRGRAAGTTELISGVDEYRLMVEHFAACVVEGRPFRYPAREAALNMRAIDALYRSARGGGETVVIPPEG